MFNFQVFQFQHHTVGWMIIVNQVVETTRVLQKLNTQSYQTFSIFGEIFWLSRVSMQPEYPTSRNCGKTFVTKKTFMLFSHYTWINKNFSLYIFYVLYIANILWEFICLASFLRMNYRIWKMCKFSLFLWLLFMKIFL